MKRLPGILIIFFITCIVSKGQWYNKKYGADDIRGLSVDQLNESLKASKLTILGGGGVVLMGGLFILNGELTYKDGLPEDPSLAEDIFGARFLRGFWDITGAAMIIGGVTAMIVGISRAGTINRVLKEYNSGYSVLMVKPAVLYCGPQGMAFPGVTVRISF